MYITNKRFKGKCLCGEINLPYGTPCDLKENIIYYQGKPICFVSSQNAYDYFSNNFDFRGLERGKLVEKIQKILQKRDDKYQYRWNKLWDDKKANEFRRQEIEDYWLWNFNFYNAKIEDLEYILNKISN